MIEGLLTCPVCSGTLRVPCESESIRHYGIKNGWYGYDVETDTIPCRNCGGQTQFPGYPTGQVLPRKDNGEPCVHEYRGYNKGRCYTGYTCVHCGDEYSIDSGD
jgi:uncharacterized protein YbaR (Trm112 family)